MTTGWPPGMLQDDSRKLSRWLSNRPGARYLIRETNMTTKDQITTQPVCLISDALEAFSAIAQPVQPKETK